GGDGDGGRSPRRRRDRRLPARAGPRSAAGRVAGRSGAERRAGLALVPAPPRGERRDITPGTAALAAWTSAGMSARALGCGSTDGRGARRAPVAAQPRSAARRITAEAAAR